MATNWNELLYSEDENANIVDAIYAVARAIDRLGTADAGTSMGAIEVLSVELKQGFEELASAIDSAVRQIGQVLAP